MSDAKARVENGAGSWLTVQEVAKILRVGTSTVKRWCANGQVPGARRFGGVWRIPRSFVSVPEPDRQ